MALFFCLNPERYDLPAAVCRAGQIVRPLVRREGSQDGLAAEERRPERDAENDARIEVHAVSGKQITVAQFPLTDGIIGIADGIQMAALGEIFFDQGNGSLPVLLRIARGRPVTDNGRPKQKD